MFKDHTLLFRARVGRKSAGRHALEFHQTLFAAYRLSTASWRFFEIQRLLAIAYTQVFQVDFPLN